MKRRGTKGDYVAGKSVKGGRGNPWKQCVPRTILCEKGRPVTPEQDMNRRVLEGVTDRVPPGSFITLHCQHP